MVLSDSQKWFWLTCLLVAGMLTWLLAPILTPFLVAVLLAYLGDPLVDRLEDWKLSRVAGVGCVFLAAFVILACVFLVLVPIIETQVSGLFRALPRYFDYINSTVVPWLRERLGLGEGALQFDEVRRMLLLNWQQAGGFAAKVAGYISKSGAAVAGWTVNLLLVPVVAFYLLRDWDVFMARIGELVPRDAAPTVFGLAREADEVLGAFMRGQLLVMLGLSMLYCIGLWLVGLEFALLIGLFAGIVSFVPYLGLIVGVIAAGLAILLQTQDPLQLIWVVAVFGVAQMVEAMLLTPLLVGDRIGLHPVAVIFAVLAGGQLFGFFGVLLALPVSAVLVVLVRHAHERYVASEMYLSAEEPPPDDGSDET